MRIASIGILATGNNTANAVADAIDDAPGATALVGVTSDSYSEFWILWRNTCTEVRGTAVKPN
jgi:hypothetical protein